MKRFLFLLATLLLTATVASAQEPQEPDIDKIVSTQLENITRTFKLDDVQVFYADSILQHNYPAMMEELNQVKKTGASNSDTFQAVSDKWMAATDEAFEKLFTEAQWAKYMKSVYGKRRNAVTNGWQSAVRFRSDPYTPKISRREAASVNRYSAAMPCIPLFRQSARAKSQPAS